MENEGINENIIVLYTRLAVYFSLSEEKRSRLREALPLPDVAKDLTDNELYYVYKFLGSYLSGIVSINEAVSEIKKLPKEQADKISNVIVEILKETLGAALALYNRLTKDNE
jgi:hypothetical protein